jgi:exonuclease III
MRILTANVRAGGNPTTIPPFIARCAAHEPDVIVLSEFRDGPRGELVRERLRHFGFCAQSGMHGRRGNAVLIAAVTPFESIGNPFELPDDEYPNAVVQASIEGIRVFGVYLPGQERKRPHLRALIAEAQRCNDEGVEALCIGDFNAGRNATDIELNLRTGKLIHAFGAADLYQELEKYWVEAWERLHPEEYEFSWYPFRRIPPPYRRNGWRLDKAFFSRSLLPRLHGAAYDHGFREELLTDHSALIVELA